MRLFQSSIILLFVLLLSACVQFPINNFEVTDCSFSETDVVISFSTVPNQYLFMKSFSLKEDSNEMTGKYEFIDKKVVFTPDYGIKDNFFYELVILSTAEDIDGNSLEKDYKQTFSTRTEFERPMILDISPHNEFQSSSEISEIKICFSESIDDASFRKAINFVPAFNYVYEWENSNTIVNIYPTEKLQKETWYEIRISNSLHDKNRNTLLNEFKSTFLNFADSNTPFFDLFLDQNGELTKLNNSTSIENINTDDKLVIQFSEKIDIDYASRYISVFPSLNLTITPDKKSQDKIFIEFNEDVIWGESYKLTINKGIKDLAGNEIKNDLFYSLRFNNENNRPISIKKVVVDLSKSNKDYVEVQNFSTLSFEPAYYPTVESNPVPTDMFFIFEISSNATGIVDFSIMENFSTDFTNACLDSLIVKKVKVLAETDIDANPKLKSVYDSITTVNGKLCVVCIGLEIENSSSNNNGLLRFSMGNGVRDSLGNMLNEEYSCQVNKI